MYIVTKWNNMTLQKYLLCYCICSNNAQIHWSCLRPGLMGQYRWLFGTKPAFLLYLALWILHQPTQKTAPHRPVSKVKYIAPQILIYITIKYHVSPGWNFNPASLKPILVSLATVQLDCNGSTQNEIRSIYNEISISIKVPMTASHFRRTARKARWTHVLFVAVVRPSFSVSRPNEHALDTLLTTYNT